jgi:hypothetical protein
MVNDGRRAGGGQAGKNFRYSFLSNFSSQPFDI